MVRLVHYLVCVCVIAQAFYILIGETASIIKNVHCGLQTEECVTKIARQHCGLSMKRRYNLWSEIKKTVRAMKRALLYSKQ